MELVMYVGLDMLDTVRLNTDQISQPGYLGSLKRELMQKHAGQLEYLSVEPEFLLVQSVEQPH